eukprot:3180940-Pyramimonas_sp.AAC.1
MRTVAFGPSVGLPMEPQNAVLGGGNACGRCGGRMRTVALGPSAGLPAGPRNAVLGAGDACGR